MDLRNSMLLANMMKTEEKMELFIIGVDGATISLPSISGAYKFHFKGKLDFSLMPNDFGLFMFKADSDDISGRNYILRFLTRNYDSKYTEIWNYFKVGDAQDVLITTLYNTEQFVSFDIEYNLDNISTLSNIIFLCNNWDGDVAKGIMFSLFEIFDSSNNKLLSITPKIENNVNGVYDSISQNFYTNTTGTLIITE